MTRYLYILLLFAFHSTTSSQSGFVNQGFESTAPGAYTTANAVNGWTVDSRINNGTCTYTNWSPGSPEFSVVATPMVNWPFASSPIGIIPHSPLGGTVVVQLNDALADKTMTRIRQTFSVTSSDALLQIAYAGYWEIAGNQNCCQRPGLTLQLYDCAGNPLPCSSFSMFPGIGCTSSGVNYSTTPNGNNWSNWQVRKIDLSYYIGSCITVEVKTTDCHLGHYIGTTLLDVRTHAVYLGSPLFPPFTEIPNAASKDQVFCTGSSTAAIYGPYGQYQYQWAAPGTGTVPPPHGTMNLLIVSNPVGGAIYTLTATSPFGCQTVRTYTLSNTQIDIVGTAIKPACPGTANGSATVVAAGSATSYSYLWVNSSNSVVSTQSLAMGLSSGIYSVTVSSSNTNCGTATKTLSVDNLPPQSATASSPYCGNNAILLTPTGASNIRWYSGNGTLISGSASVTPAFTITAPCNGCSYISAYTNFMGCRDSVKYSLYPAVPGQLAIPQTGIKSSCFSANNGTAVITMTSSTSAPPWVGMFSVTSTGTTNPFTVSSGPVSPNAFTVGGLATGTYSVNASDGLCSYNSTFTIDPAFSFSLSTTQATMCAEGGLAVSINFANTPVPGTYTYSWSPTTWLVGGNGHMQQTIIFPKGVPSGSVVNLIYTVVVTSTIDNCPSTRTMSITVANPTINSISALPPLCDNFGTHSVIVDPPGGTFLNSPLTPGLLKSGGLVDPTKALPGTNSFTYAVNVGTCVATKSSTFHISKFQNTQLFISTLPLCKNSPPFNLNLVPQNSVTGGWHGPGVQNTHFYSNSVSTGTYALIYSTPSTPNSTLCPDSDTLLAIVAPLPTVAANSGTICSGQTFVINAAGAVSYSYSGGSGTINPTATSAYSVWGISEYGCRSSSAAVINISVIPLPDITISSRTDTLCHGETATLTASGATNYFWTNGPSTNSYVVQPFVSTHFKVTGESNGCSTASQYYIEVRYCTGLDQLRGSGVYSLFPNPAGEKLYVQTGRDQKHELKIYTLSGKLILSEIFSGTTHTVDLLALPKGMYQLHIRSKEKDPAAFTFIKE